MKKKYFKPSLEVYKVENEDIIATSGSTEQVGFGGSGSHRSKGYFGDDDYDEDF